MTKTLITKSRYRNTAMRVDWHAGRVDTFTDAQAAQLLRDAPGVFEEVDPVALEAANAARDAALAEAYGAEETVADEPPEEVQPSAVDEDDAVGEEPVDDDGLEQLSLVEIRELASRQQISLAGLRRKQDMIAALRE